ncbi:MAG: hypothetical protein AAB334_02575 [Patescibacteria group bacterium]
MENNEKAPSIFTFLWFLLKVILFDAAFIYLLSLLLKSFGTPDLLLSIIVVVAGILFFIAYFIFSLVWQQEKNIKKDDEEHKRNLQKV